MLQFFKRAAATVTAAAAGKVRLFIDTDGLPKTKDELGAVVVLGNGIDSITLLGTTGLNKMYRILLQDGSFFDYAVADGLSIVSLVKVNTVGLVDTYRITFNDGTTFDYTVTNGANGQGTPAVNNPTRIDPDDAAAIGTRTAFYALEDHQHQIVTDVPVALGAANAEGTSASFARSDHVHLNPVIAHEAAVDPHPQYTTTAEAAAAAPVQSFNGRTGAITPQQADYDAFFTTPAEASAAAPVQSFNGRTGAITPQQADYDAFFTTPAEASAAAPVQSVAGKQGAVTLNSADVGLGNVRNPVTANVHTVTAQTLNQTLTAAATMTIPANSLQAGDAFEIDVLFGTLVNTTAASNLEVAVFINGTQNAIATAALGTTAVAAPGRGGRALFKVVFRTVGAAGTALANGTVHVNALANFASNNVANQTVNTTADVQLQVRVRTSAATSTGTVQFAAIDQAT